MEIIKKIIEFIMETQLRFAIIVVGFIVFVYIFKIIYYKIIINKIPFLKTYYQNKLIKMYHVEKSKLWLLLSYEKRYNDKMKYINNFLKIFPNDEEVLERKKKLIKFKK